MCGDSSVITHHITTGGYPAFSSLYGIGPDSVKGCEVSNCGESLCLDYRFAGLSLMAIQVVLADGSVVEANAHSHSELWRALKGGTSNFGRWKIIFQPARE